LLSGELGRAVEHLAEVYTARSIRYALIDGLRIANSITSRGHDRLGTAL
jgi:hypothetical protein